MKVLATIEINNAPSFFERYTVVRRSEDGSLWYYGTFDDKTRAHTAQKEINNGIMVEVENG